MKNFLFGGKHNKFQIWDLEQSFEFDGALHIIVCWWTNVLYSIVVIILKHDVNTLW